jgi:CRP/FNR family transcriptional regulator, cyclic AMP receptor protein
MDGLMAADWIEAMGWMAAVMTVATYAMKTMMTLRILAITSSLFFVTYAGILQLWPLLAMELILLPINGYRLWQIVSLRTRLRQDGGDAADFSVIRSYGRPRHIRAGSVIFALGDPVDRLYYIGSGRVLIEEVGVDVTAGDIFGEIAFFTELGTRTATARCLEDTTVYEVDRTRFMRLQFEDPSFGLSVMRTVTRRLMSEAYRGMGAAQLP